jgi:hypothetical protein
MPSSESALVKASENSYRALLGGALKDIANRSQAAGSDKCRRYVNLARLLSRVTKKLTQVVRALVVDGVQANDASSHCPI